MRVRRAGLSRVWLRVAVCEPAPRQIDGRCRVAQAVNGRHPWHVRVYAVHPPFTTTHAQNSALTPPRLHPPLGRSTSSSAARPFAALNGHLEPAFRLLERLARGSTVARGSLRDADAVASLAPAVEWAQSAGVLPRSVGARGVRVLSLILGGDVEKLIAAVELATAQGEKASQPVRGTLPRARNGAIVSPSPTPTPFTPLRCAPLLTSRQS